MRTILNLLLFGTLVFVFSCTSPTGESAETTISGDIRIGVDDNLRLITEAELFIFETDYKDAKVRALYGPEGDMVDLLMKDSVRLVITGRKLSTDETKFFNSKKIHPREQKIAIDGLALVVNKANSDSTFSHEQLKALFTGKAGRWSDFDPANGDEAIRVVFDNPKSGNAGFIKQHFNLKELPSNCYALKSNEEVLKYVENNAGSIGIIGSNYISDSDDSLSQSILKRVKVAGVSAIDDPKAIKGYHGPYQEYIADESYPFRRDVFIISRELGTHLGNGFIAFVTGDKGQRIILKAGLVPVVFPTRTVEIISE